ncbi:MAG: KOW domain-containing RNA-binding protein [Acetatifactor sp.]|nr:KOW domain-containing RNA-binding protein [Acetatifactor sp.]
MIGSFVTSKAGHDKGRLYVVLAEMKDSVLLADGRLKTVASPKKKKKRHVQPINTKVDKSLLGKLNASGQVTDEEIKYAVKSYLKQIPN